MLSTFSVRSGLILSDDDITAIVISNNTKCVSRLENTALSPTRYQELALNRVFLKGVVYTPVATYLQAVVDEYIRNPQPAPAGYRRRQAEKHLVTAT
jgi:hypothetical protein